MQKPADSFPFPSRDNYNDFDYRDTMLEDSSKNGGRETRTRTYPCVRIILFLLVIIIPPGGRYGDPKAGLPLSFVSRIFENKLTMARY
jgi:hypothetical protein